MKRGFGHYLPVRTRSPGFAELSRLMRGKMLIVHVKESVVLQSITDVATADTCGVILAIEERTDVSQGWIDQGELIVHQELLDRVSCEVGLAAADGVCKCLPCSQCQVGALVGRAKTFCCCLKAGSQAIAEWERENDYHNKPRSVLKVVWQLSLRMIRQIFKR